jgi:tetratricopeptide (TPR) repeat protein
MSDPLRTNPIDSPEPHADAEREAKIESLLLSGLDHYFASDYAQAIDVWTRALFLDRTHQRARAYIERARSALAEQQRESEELLHNGIAAFERGEMEAARQLLNAAVQRGGAHEVGLAFLTRIDRLSAAATAASTAAAIPAKVPVKPATAPTSRSGARTITTLIVVTLLIAIVYGLGSWGRVRALLPILGSQAGADLAPSRPVQEVLVIPRSSEATLERAKTFYGSGRLYDALRAIDLIRPTDPLRGDADKLKAAIQLKLLAHQTSSSAPGGVEPVMPPSPPTAGAPAPR